MNKDRSITSKLILLAALVCSASMVVLAGCSDPDTDAVKASMNHPVNVAKPPTGDAAAQKQYDDYMKAHPEAPGSMPTK